MSGSDGAREQQGRGAWLASLHSFLCRSPAFCLEVWRGYKPWERALLLLCLGVILFCLGWRWGHKTGPRPFFYNVVTPQTGQTR
jgi:hypothetical protein